MQSRDKVVCNISCQYGMLDKAFGRAGFRITVRKSLEHVPNIHNEGPFLGLGRQILPTLCILELQSSSIVLEKQSDRTSEKKKQKRSARTATEHDSLDLPPVSMSW